MHRAFIAMNFIVIVSDSFRFDNLACYERLHPRFRTPRGLIRTPHLDRFAGRAAIFDRAYVGSYPTVPCRHDIFTGRMRPFHLWEPLGAKAITLPKRLREAGYLTQMIQDTPHTLNKGFNFQRDFDGWLWVRGQEGDCLASRLPGEFIDPDPRRGNIPYVQHVANRALTRRHEDDCYCAQTMIQATHWLERHYRQERFFLYVDTFDPHEPWDAPEWYERLYERDYTGYDYRYGLYGRSNVYTPRERAHLSACYAAEATLVDRWIGFLLDAIERMGLMDNTCIVFTSDHGLLVGEHGWMGKNAPPMYDEIAHIPLLMHMPGQERPRRVGALVQPCDLMPTLLDLAGAETPESLDGVSLKPTLEGSALRTRRYAFSRGDKGLLTTDREWALVYPTVEKGKPSRPPELFHLKTDPLQETNVLKKNLPQARRLYDAYVEWLRAGGIGVERLPQERP